MHGSAWYFQRAFLANASTCQPISNLLSRLVFYSPSRIEVYSPIIYESEYPDRSDLGSRAPAYVYASAVATLRTLRFESQYHDELL